MQWRLTKEAWKVPFLFRHTRIHRSCHLREEVPSRPQSYLSFLLILAFPASMSNKFPLFKSCPVYSILFTNLNRLWQMQSVCNLVWSNLRYFSFLMMWKWFLNHRYHIWNLDHFLGWGWCGTYHLSFTPASGRELQLLASHMTTRVSILQGTVLLSHDIQLVRYINKLSKFMIFPAYNGFPQVVTPF